MGNTIEYGIVEDWQRIALSAGISGSIGFLAGVLAEPLKVILKNRYELRRLRNRLLREIAETYTYITEGISAIETHEAYPWGRYRKYFWYEYATNHIEVAKDLKEWDWIDGIYRAFIYTDAAVPKDYTPWNEPKELLWKAKQACKTVEEFHGIGMWSRTRPLLKHVPRHLRHRFKYRFFLLA